MKFKNYKITEFKRMEASDEVIHKYFRYSDVLRRERDPDEPSLPEALRVQLIREPNPRTEEYELIMWDGDKIIANGEFGHVTPKAPNYDSDKHIVGISINVLPHYRRQGIGTELLRLIVKKVEEIDGITTIFAGSFLESGLAFCKKFGGKENQKGAENRLRIEDVDWDLITSWKEAGEQLSHEEGVVIEMFEDCPDEIIEPYTKLYTETMNQQPLGSYDGKIVITPETRREDEKKNHDRKLEWYTMITREKDGTISGLTEMWFHQDISYKAFQNLTGVQENYRGRGLGKWLKANMLLWMYDKYPSIKYISTGNADTNAPMLSINRRMGFKEFISNTSFLFNATDLIDKFT